MRFIIINIIKFYKFFTKDLGLLNNRCVFTPTCSEYTTEAIEIFGVWKGIYMGVKRIFKCHPKQKKYYDPVTHKQ